MTFPDRAFPHVRAVASCGPADSPTVAGAAPELRKPGWLALTGFPFQSPSGTGRWITEGARSLSAWRARLYCPPDFPQALWMNRRTLFFCIAMLAATTSTLQASEPIATRSEANSSAPITDTDAKADADNDPAGGSMLLPGASGSQDRGGLITRPSDDVVCGDPAAGSCGGVETADTQPAKPATDSTESDRHRHRED